MTGSQSCDRKKQRGEKKGAGVINAEKSGG
jgi:hypothetical protein